MGIIRHNMYVHSRVCLDEKNPTSKEIIMKRVEGYMSRAEQLREMLEANSKPKAVSVAGGTAEK